MRSKNRLIGRSLFLCLLCALFTINVQARDTAPAAVGASTRSDPIELLKAGKYAALDAQMNGIQAAYEHGKIEDVAVLDAFRAFYLPDPSLEPYYVIWIKRYPHSYAAHLALGIYYKYQGRDARGGAYASEVSQQNMNLMDLAFASALPELNKSLTLTKKPIVTYIHLMDITAHTGNRATADAELDAANRADPHNFAARMKYMEIMRPRWLGRPGDMRAFYERCRADRLSPAQLNVLQALVLDDEASNEQDSGIDDTVVRDEYAKAIALAAPHAAWLAPGEYEGMLAQASSLSFQIKDYQAAFNYADTGIKIAPHSDDMFKLHGISNLELGRKKQAAADLETSANLGNEWSQLYVGELYAKGEIVPKDLHKARGFFEAAAKQGSKEAAQNLQVLDNWQAASQKR